MSVSVEVKGLDEVRKNLRREIRKFKTGISTGLIKAAIVVRGESMRNSPVDSGNLRASHYVYWTSAAFEAPPFSSEKTNEVSGDEVKKLKQSANEEGLTAQAEVKGRFHVRVGASAYYAGAVHEAPPSTNFTVGGRKFLQRAVEENEPILLKIIENEARI